MILITYPSIEKYRDQPWFKDEAIPATEREQLLTGSEAYWIPKERHYEFN